MDLDLVVTTYAVELGDEIAVRRKKSLMSDRLSEKDVRAIIAYGLRSDFG